jgi:cytochrome b561
VQVDAPHRFICISTFPWKEQGGPHVHEYPDRYGLIARLLHWLIAALVIGMLAGGSLLSFLPPGGFKGLAVATHKSIGVLIFLLMIARLLWRCFNLQPRDLGNIPVLNYIAHVLHIGLYILLILQPLSGILMSQSHGYPVVVFGWFNCPRWYGTVRAGQLLP